MGTSVVAPDCSHFLRGNLGGHVLRNIVVMATLQRERQQSSDPAAHFEARLAQIGVSVRF